MDTTNLTDSTNAHNLHDDVGSQLGAAGAVTPESIDTQGDVGHRAPVTGSKLDLISLADIKPENVAWLWPGWVPFGKVTIIEGDPGQGKSQITLDIAARLTTGQPFPTGESPSQGNVIMLTSEDGLADTVRPRLDAAGGDPARVYAVRGMLRNDGTTDPLTLPIDIGALRGAIIGCGAKLVILDALVDYLGPNVNTWKDSDVRRALGPIARLAEETGVAVVLVMHLNKGTERAAMYRGGGSIAFPGVARMVLVVAPNPDEPESHVLSGLKANLGALPTSLSYSIVEAGHASRIHWEGECSYNAIELLAQSSGAHPPRKNDGAKKFLDQVLPLPKEEAIEQGNHAGYTKRTLERAFKDLGGLTTKEFGGAATWRLPSHEGLGAVEAFGEGRDHAPRVEVALKGVTQ